MKIYLQAAKLALLDLFSVSFFKQCLLLLGVTLIMMVAAIIGVGIPTAILYAILTKIFSVNSAEAAEAIPYVASGIVLGIAAGLSKLRSKDSTAEVA